MNDIVAVIFSKDRALQLDATLQSFKKRCLDKFLIDVKVLYKASSYRHKVQYESVQFEQAYAKLVQQEDFKKDLLSITDGYKYILFVVDDTIFVKDFLILDCISGITNHRSCGFSLRLGLNIGKCYTEDGRPMILPLPEFVDNKKQILTFDWTRGSGDFSYPLELSSSLYPAETVKNALDFYEYNEPNTLESCLAYFAWQVLRLQGNTLLSMFDTSVAFSTPMNKVQNVAKLNRCSTNDKYDPECLADKYDTGFRIDIEKLKDFESETVHQEIDFLNL